jgi:hypothetical protein
MKSDRSRKTSGKTRARKLGPADVKYLKRAAPTVSSSVLTARLNKRLARNRRATVSKKTVHRALASGYKPYKPLGPQKTKPVSARNKKDRLEYCNITTAAELEVTAFGDSKTFDRQRYVTGAGKKTWQQPGKRRIMGGSSSNVIEHIYAMVGLGYKSRLFRVPLKTRPQIAACRGHGVQPFSNETFKSQHFIDVLPDMVADAEEHYGHLDWWLVLDRARQHTSEATMDFIQQQQVPLDFSFPAASPDLNPIENVWSMVDYKLHNMPLGTPAQFFQKVQQAWDAVPQSDIDNTVRALKTRHEMVKKAGGGRLLSTHTGNR